jgi:hypothetical protein
VRPRNNLGNFEIQDLLAPTIPNTQLAGGSLIDSTGVFTHWREPLAATFRLLPLLDDGARLKRLLGPSDFSESSISLQPGTVIDFVNTDFRARSIVRDRLGQRAAARRGISGLPSLSGVGFFQDRVPMRSSPHPPNPLLPHGEQGEPPQIPLPDAVRSPSPAQV